MTSKESFPEGSEQRAIEEVERMLGFRKNLKEDDFKNEGLKEQLILQVGFIVALGVVSSFNLGEAVTVNLKSLRENQGLSPYPTFSSNLAEIGINLLSASMIAVTCRDAYKIVTSTSNKARTWEIAFAIQRLRPSVLS